MLMTLSVANNIKIANHNLDPNAIFIEALNLKSLNIRKGLATDYCTIDIPRQALDQVSSLIYLTSMTSCDLSIFVSDYFNEPVWLKVLSGYISQVAEKQKDYISLKIASKYTYYQNQSFMPKITNICQNQLYSKICTLSSDNYKVNFTNVNLDCLTGKLAYSLTTNTFTLNGVTSALPAQLVGRPIKDFEQAYVLLGNTFKSRVIGIADGYIYIDLNFRDMSIITDVSLILSCDKSYGTCYKKFSNVGNFYAFANLTQQPKNYNIFTSNALDYCGDYEAQPSCSLDNTLFGVEL